MERLTNLLQNKLILLFGAIILGFGIGKLATKVNTKETVLLVMMLATVYLLLTRKFYLRQIVLLLIFSGFIGSSIELFRAGPVTFFPFRLVLFAYWVLFITAIANKVKIPSHVKYISIYLVFLAFWQIIAFLSMGWSLSVFDAIRSILFLFGGISIIFAMALTDLDYIIKNTIRIWSCVYIGFILFAFFERFTGIHMPVSGSNFYPFDYMRFWPTVVFRNPNDFTAFLALSFPFAIMFIESRHIVLKVLGVGSIISTLYFITVVGSRANLIGIAVQFVALFWLIDFKKRMKFIGIGLLIILIVFGIFSDSFMETVADMKGMMESLQYQYENNTGSVSTRINLIRNGLYLLSRNPFLGIGSGNIEYYMLTRSYYDNHGVLNIHNWWFEILVNYGIVVFIFYLLFFVAIWLNLYRMYRKNHNPEIKVAYMGMSGFVIISISSSSIMALNFIWCLFGLAICLIARERMYRKEGLV